MGEPTCVMHAFSYTPGISSEAKEQDNPMYALEESVSLGKFMSESLSWEKWSTFSRNRYVEEAEMYSRPGSVKQKKAYFEAHFKRMAALKAAALLEQANATQAGASDESKAEGEVHNDGSNINDHADLHDQQLALNSQPRLNDQQGVEMEADNSCCVANLNEHNPDFAQVGAPDEPNVEAEAYNDGSNINDLAELHGQQLVSSSPPNINDQQVVQKETDNSGFVANHNEHNPNVAQGGAPDEPNAETEEQNDGSNINDHADIHVEQLVLSSPPSIKDEQEVENSGFVPNNKEHNPSDGEDQLRSKIIQETDLAAFVESTEHLMDVEKQNPSTEMESGSAKTEESCLKGSSISQDIFVASSPRSKRNPPLSAYIPSPPMSRRNPTLSSYMPSIEAARSLISSSSPAKSVAKPFAVYPGKESTCTPVGSKCWVEDPDKKRTPLHMSINRELNRLISPVIKKIGSSSRASNKDCSTPLKTPGKASVNGMTNAPPERSPQSRRRRARALFDSSACGSKAARPRGAKSPAAGRNKTSSPIIPKAFCLGGDRVPRRKENLEEKFNAKATENAQQQSKLKEKPKELAKLRQSFCFGSKLSSDSFRERDRLEVPTEKSKVTDEHLPKKGRSRVQNMTFLPPRRPPLEGTKNVKQKKGEIASSNSSRVK